MKLWHSEQPVSKIDWAVYVFIAKGLEKVDEQRLDTGEKIDAYTVTFDEFMNVALTDEFNEREIVKYVYEAKLDKHKMEKLRELFKPL